MALHVNQNDIMAIISRFGNIGVFIAMFLESSVIPIPSEVIIIGAGAIGIPLISILIFGALGSTVGAMVGYLLGRYAAMPVILKFGRLILIKHHHIQKAEAFAKKYGAVGVLIGRILPIVPFKVFSIASGITNVPVVPFVACTMIGVLPRIYILVLFGNIIMRYHKQTVFALAGIALIFIAIFVTRKIYNGKRQTASD